MLCSPACRAQYDTLQHRYNVVQEMWMYERDLVRQRVV